jgi:hypothetical protein
VPFISIFAGKIGMIGENFPRTSTYIGLVSNTCCHPDALSINALQLAHSGSEQFVVCGQSVG